MRQLKNTTGETAGLEACKEMKTRVITGGVLVAVLLLVLYVFPSWVLAWVVSLMLAVGVYELLFRTGLVKNMRMVAYAMASAFAIPLLNYYPVAHGWTVLASLVFVAANFGEMMRDHIRVRFENVCICLFAGLIIPNALSAFVRIFTGRFGIYMAAVPCVLAFIPDSGAYFAGRFFGKRKLAPVISPKKTVEGAVGGTLTAMLSMIIYGLVLQLAWHFKVNYLYALMYGLVGSLGAVFGDLCFSVIKRQTGIKDYGSLFPGHGGILDRFDSMMVVAPLTEVLLSLIPLV